MEASESPLDVLSRAATMLQDTTRPELVWKMKDGKSCPGKDVTSTRWRRDRRRVLFCNESLLSGGDHPLDMSTRRNPRNLSAALRPSVIAVAPTSQPGHRRQLSSGTCDPVIDEHFRRSLGKEYKDLFDGSNSSPNSHCTGLTVDDHFAKALGETWVKLQEEDKAKKAALMQQLIST